MRRGTYHHIDLVLITTMRAMKISTNTTRAIGIRSQGGTIPVYVAHLYNSIISVFYLGNVLTFEIGRIKFKFIR